MPTSGTAAYRRGTRAALAALLCMAFAADAATGSALDPATEIAPFAREVAERHGLDAARVAAILGGARVLGNVLEAIQRPAESKPWRDYRPIFVTETRIARGVEFWREHADILSVASERFGVPEGIIVAIIGVETFYGSRAGNIRVLDALATLGFRYPRRSDFFRRELASFLVLGEREGLDVSAVAGSYAGAMGIPQFIPSSYLEYAVDFDGDGQRDLMGSVADAIGSVGAYLARHGWQRGGPIAVPARVNADAREAIVARGIKPHSALDELERRGVTPAEPLPAGGEAALIELDGDAGTEHWLGFTNFYVVTRYNHSSLYAMAVHQLAQAIAARRAAAGG